MLNIFQYKIIFLFLAGLLLGGCFGSPSSVPEDRFYTFKVTKADKNKTKFRRIAIKKVHAYGLYNERALLYSHADKPLQIKRYHYHHWVVPPTQLVQQSLKDYLGQSNIADDVVVQAISPNDALRVSAELLAFERVIKQAEQFVRVEIEFEVRNSNRKYKTYKYSEIIKTSKNTLHSTAEAYGKALGKIYQKFVMAL